MIGGGFMSAAHAQGWRAATALGSVSRTRETMVAERALAAASTGLCGTADAGRGAVTVDDLALFAGRFSNGSLGSFEATVPAAEQCSTTILATEPEHPCISAWRPAGHMPGCKHGFSYQVRDVVEAIPSATASTPSFANGLRVQRVPAAVEDSAAAKSVCTAV